MRDSVLATITRHHMLSRGDHVVVALSGGADSVALLRMLLELTPTLGILVSACHVNHQLRGAESERDEMFCSSLCEALGVALSICRVDVRACCAQQRLSIEEGARLLRYRALREVTPNGKIATAHTLSDSCETVLWNITRGTALDGLCGILPVSGRVIRPLIDISRREVEAYLAWLGQDFVTDSSNLGDEYTRNRLRHGVIPLLTAENSAFEQAVRRMTMALSRDRDCLDTLAGEAEKMALLPDGGYCRTNLLALPEALCTRVLRQILSHGGALCSFSLLEHAYALLQLGSGALELHPGMHLTCKGESLRLVCTEQAFPPVPETAVQMEALPVSISLGSGKTLSLRLLLPQEIKLFVNKRSDEFQNVLDCAKLDKILIVRGRRQGDTLRQIGRGCTKTMKKLMNEAKIPLQARAAVVVLESGGRLVWVEGFGTDEAILPDEKTVQALLVQINKEESLTHEYE